MSADQRHRTDTESAPPTSPVVANEGPLARIERSLRPTSPLTHIVVLSSILLPVALLPYLAVRRKLISLHKEVVTASTGSVVLRQDLKAALREASVGRDEHNRMRESLHEVQAALKKMEEADKAKSIQREVNEKNMRKTIDILIADKRKTGVYLSQLQELGTSLADVAAFMQEVEIQHGLAPRKKDGRGIERIRLLAQKLRDLPQDHVDPAKK